VTTKRLYDFKQCVQGLDQEQLQNDVKGLQCSAKGEYERRGSSSCCIILHIGQTEMNKLV